MHSKVVTSEQEEEIKPESNFRRLLLFRAVWAKEQAERYSNSSMETGLANLFPFFLVEEELMLWDGRCPNSPTQCTWFTHERVHTDSRWNRLATTRDGDPKMQQDLEIDMRNTNKNPLEAIKHKGGRWQVLWPRSTPHPSGDEGQGGCHR